MLTPIRQFDLLSPLAASEVAITGAVTLTSTAFGRMHLISGTSADYTIGLPAASGNSGKMIGFRVAAAASASKLYTLDGNASETIDGATTRILWAEEAAILECDGSNWFKVAGKSRPMSAKIRASAAQTSGSTIPTAINAFFTVMLRTTIFDNTGLMASNDTLTVKRAGNYFAVGGVGCNSNSASDAGEPFLGGVYLNSVDDSPRLGRCPLDDYGYGAFLSGELMQNLFVGDTVKLRAYVGATVGTASAVVYSDMGNSQGDWAMLQLTEVPSW